MYNNIIQQHNLSQQQKDLYILPFRLTFCPLGILDWKDWWDSTEFMHTKKSAAIITDAFILLFLLVKFITFFENIKIYKTYYFQQWYMYLLYMYRGI